MKEVFVGGSRRISRLNEVVRARLEAMIGARLGVLVGDANGADKAVQKHFADQGYRTVTVFYSGAQYRNNLSNWPTQQVQPGSGQRGFLFYVAKDVAMAKEADYGFMLWDGKSKGTLNNVLNLIERRKKVVVYFDPEQRCYTLSSMDALRPLLRACPDDALAGFRRSIELEARLQQAEAEANPA